MFAGWVKFALTQIVNVALMIVGVPVCWVLTSTGTMYIGNDGDRAHFPKWAWVWDNDDDGVMPGWYNPPPQTRWRAFVWTAFRNPVDNLKHVPGVATPGGPLLYRTWTWFGKEFYYKIGYMPHEGYPAFQPFGAGRGY